MIQHLIFLLQVSFLIWWKLFWTIFINVEFLIICYFIRVLFEWFFVNRRRKVLRTWRFMISFRGLILNAFSTILNSWRFHLMRWSYCRWSLTIKKLKTSFTWTLWGIMRHFFFYFWNWSFSFLIIIIWSFYVWNTWRFFSFLQRNLGIIFLNDLIISLCAKIIICLFFLTIFYDLMIKIKSCLFFVS